MRLEALIQVIGMGGILKSDFLPHAERDTRLPSGDTLSAHGRSRKTQDRDDEQKNDSESKQFRHLRKSFSLNSKNDLPLFSIRAKKGEWGVLWQ
jgi:hypothetical protein